MEIVSCNRCSFCAMGGYCELHEYIVNPHEEGCEEGDELPMNEVCPECGGIMKSELDQDEPLLRYECTKCSHSLFERINGYEG